MFCYKFFICVCFFSGVVCDNRKFALSDDIYYKAPKLFSLDDYAECFSYSEGVYCMGDFVLKSDETNEVLYALKKHSEHPSHFNHTKVHKGVCLSRTCSTYKSDNFTSNFERCVSDGIFQNHGLKAELESLHYCRTTKEYLEGHHVDKWDKLYLYVVYFLITFNVIGSIYDSFTRGRENRNNYLLAWSFWYNIQKLVGDNNGSDPRINDLDCSYGGRVITLTLVMFSHLAWTNYVLYLHDPRILEEISKEPALIILINGPLLIQWFILLSTMLLTYNILITSETYQKLSIKMVPVSVILRLIRIAPLYYLIYGFVATWWKHLGYGPLWPILAEKETQTCRESFWKNILFYNNIMIGQSKCIHQSWFLATDLHIYIIASTFVLLMWKMRAKYVYTILGILFVLSCFMNSFLSYYLDLKPHLFLGSTENLRVFLDGVMDLFLYCNPMNSLPACFMGIAGAWFIYNCKTNNYELGTNKWFMLAFKCSLPLAVVWIQSGYWVKKYSSTKLYVAIYAGIDKPVFGLILLPFIVGGVCKVNDKVWKFFAWKGWHPLGRSSLAAMLIHWHFQLYLLGNMTMLREVAWTHVIVEATGIIVCVYAIAGLLTATVEYPIKNTFKIFMLSRLKLKQS